MISATALSAPQFVLRTDDSDRRRHRRTRRQPTAEDRFVEASSELFTIAYRSAYKILGDARASEDIAQEAGLRAYMNWARVETYAAAWTTRVATNLAIDEWRRHRAAPLDDVDHVADDHSGHVIRRDDLRRALDTLSARRREAIVLRVIHDFSPSQTAAAMGISVAEVHKHTARGLVALRPFLDPPSVRRTRRRGGDRAHRTAAMA